MCWVSLQSSHLAWGFELSDCTVLSFCQGSCWDAELENLAAEWSGMFTELNACYPQIRNISLMINNSLCIMQKVMQSEHGCVVFHAVAHRAETGARFWGMEWREDILPSYIQVLQKFRLLCWCWYPPEREAKDSCMVIGNPCLYVFPNRLIPTDVSYDTLISLMSNIQKSLIMFCFC